MKLYIYQSQRQDKRFVAVFVENDEIKYTTHFGSANGATFIDHGDITKRSNYLKRHAVNEDWDDYKSAGSLARWILWNTDDIYKNIELFKSKFNLQ
jgi:hypothetical protein